MGTIAKGHADAIEQLGVKCIGGNFILEIRFLSMLDGHEIKTLQLATNADASKVMATRAGRFIVRTGEILYLYSADFEKIATKPLPLDRKVQRKVIGRSNGSNSSLSLMSTVHFGVAGAAAG